MRLPAALALALLVPLAACGTTPPEESVKPGINESFLDPDLDVESFVERFEVESREIFSSRFEIAASVGLEPGDEVGDVGAGTGLFLELFAEAVGPEGRVYAIDIAPKFIERLETRAEAGGYSHVEARLCSEDSIDMPPGSLDAAFVCDTYHHFEYPMSTLASIHEALRSGGELFVIDFERIEGVTREWLMNHVRAGKEVFRAEIEAAGFELVEELEIGGLAENYALRFVKR